MIGWLMLLACQVPVVPAAPHPTVPPPTAPPPPGAPHPHEATHEGTLSEVGPLHVEARIETSGGMFWVAGPEGTAISDWTATAALLARSEVSDIGVTPMGDHLHAAAELTLGEPASIALTLRRGAESYTVLATTPAAGMAFHDHRSLHGGQVQMLGHVHIEYAPVDGQARFWFTDEHRRPMTQGVRASAAQGEARFELVFDPETGLGSGGPVAGDQPVTLTGIAAGLPLDLRFEAVD